MTNDQHRSVDLDRLERGRYRVTNPRGGELTIGDGSGDDFTPVELLLTAIAGCTAVDVDFLITKRAEPIRFRVRSTGEKLPDHRMADLEVIFDVEFGDDDAGRTAEGRLPEAIGTSHDRLCTVSRTVEQGVPVRSRVRDGSDVDGSDV